MMNELKQLLRNIGLSEKEAITYLENLRIGTNPASIIAKHSNINRGTTYTILESLSKKGLVHQIEKNKIRYYTAAEPKHLMHYIDLKRRDLSYHKKELHELLEVFSELKHPYHTKPRFKSYSGKVGRITIYNEIITEKSINIWSISSNNPNEFFTRFAPHFIKQERVIRISNNDGNSIENYHVKTIQDLKQIQHFIPFEFIGSERVFITPSQETFSLEIISAEVAHLFNEKFDKLWSI